MKLRSFLTVIFLGCFWPSKARCHDILGPIVKPTGMKVTTSQYKIGFKIARSDTGAVLNDSTDEGRNAYLFPDFLNDLNAVERDEFFHGVGLFLANSVKRKLS